MEIVIKGLEDTETLANAVASAVESGDVICLAGELGTGKTTFSKAFCKSLGVKDAVTSPTFNIVNEYDGDVFKINHFDVYRLSGVDELYDIGFDEYIYATVNEDVGEEKVSIIEWADAIGEVIPEKALWIYIDFTASRTRKFDVKSRDRGVQKRFTESIKLHVKL